jgi:apolipoprotein N-acyltransferase
MTRSKPFTWIAAALFALVALAHIVRVVTHFDVVFGSHHVPMWVSYVAIVVTAFLSWMLCREARGAAPDQP